jgi:hypothetical protein
MTVAGPISSCVAIYHLRLLKQENVKLGQFCDWENFYLLLYVIVLATSSVSLVLLVTKFRHDRFRRCDLVRFAVVVETDSIL